jgi:hypothetical protein
MEYVAPVATYFIFMAVRMYEEMKCNNDIAFPTFQLTYLMLSPMGLQVMKGWQV